MLTSPSCSRIIGIVLHLLLDRLADVYLHTFIVQGQSVLATDPKLLLLLRLAYVTFEIERGLGNTIIAAWIIVNSSLDHFLSPGCPGGPSSPFG
jgi:hypothetical protein